MQTLRLTLESWSRQRHELNLRFGIGGRNIDKRFVYPDVDLIDLERRYGRESLERMYFHLMAFGAIPLASARPTSIAFGPLARFHTSAFADLWRAVFRNISAQWRYENNLAGYQGPEFEDPLCADDIGPLEIEPGPIDTLSFSGGGKDSLVAMKLLERAGIPFASFAYSHPAYGPAEPQHALIDYLADATAARRRHRLRIEGGIAESHLCAETPAAVMAALPVVLAHGYRYLAIGHERSADAANLYWKQAGETVNHQWAKSLDAELLMGRYLQTHLADLSYFSLLKPIHDVVIFNLLHDDLDAIERTHSCNRHKPWCRRCPKCAYVWLNYMAWLPQDRVRRMFPDNLFEIPENHRWFRQLMGIGAHKPFECVGEIDESRLAFALCRRKGLRGEFADACASELPADAEVIQHYFTVHRSPQTIPAAIAEGVYTQMERGAARARQRVDSFL